MVPFVRCSRGYRAVQKLRMGLHDVELAKDLSQRVLQRPDITPEFAEDVVRIFRAQACTFKLLAVTHRSRWSALADAELLDAIDGRLPGFAIQLRARDAKDNRRAQQVRLASSAGALLLNGAECRTEPAERRRDLAVFGESLAMLAAMV